MAVDEGSSAGLGTIRASNLGSSASIPIDSSNIGFQLLKKQGWKEGTGLGVYEQGRLEPIETTIKKNKRGLGAEKAKKIVKQSKHKDEDDPEMADTYAILKQQMERIVELEGHVDRFRGYERNPADSLGNFLGTYLTLWSIAKERGVTGYEACQRLIQQLPLDWKEWVVTLLCQMIVIDRVTFLPTVDFSLLVSCIFMRLATVGSPPNFIVNLTTSQATQLVNTDTTNAAHSVDLPPPPYGLLHYYRGKKDFEVGSSRVQVQNRQQWQPELQVTPFAQPHDSKGKRKWEDRCKGSLSLEKSKKSKKEDKRQQQTQVGKMPECPNCHKNHLGECIRGTNACYKCKQPGHFAKDCSTNTVHL